MSRGKTLVPKGAVQRAAHGILAAATAAGVTGDIEVNLLTGVVRFRMGGHTGPPSPAAEETSDDLRKLL
jgi:hypothetical protein